MQDPALPVTASVSRRAAVTGLLAGALVVGLDPVTRTWASAAHAGGRLDHVPALDGELRTDPAALAEAADDFGHIVSRTPLAVLRPGSVRDVARMIRFCAARGIPVAGRGQGHSTNGQSQVEAGLVIETATLDSIEIKADRAVVGGGVTWSALVRAAVAEGRTPPVLTDYLGLSVGGTLSAGGVGGAMVRHGAQVDTVLALRVVTGTGEVLACSPTLRPALFHAVLSGLGQVGVIVEATVRLVPAPSAVRRYNLSYPGVAEMTAAQRSLALDGRFDYLEGSLSLLEGGGFGFTVEAVAFDATPADDDRLIGDLTHTAVVIDDLTYWDFADRISPIVTILETIGEWRRPHPWLDSFVPGTRVEEIVTGALPSLTVQTVGASAVLLLYAIPTAKVRAPLLRMGSAREDGEEFVFLFSQLRTSSAGSLDAAAMTALNRSFYETNRAAGGGWYPIGSLPLSKADWRAHFGPAWPAFRAAKGKYDPAGILTPGQGIF